MLRSLSIRDVVLIDQLDLTLGPGLCVLTGETGAGKSILLDALGLATGERADAGLVRSGSPKAVVVAEFDVAPDHPCLAELSEQGIDVDRGETLILRRILGADGRSRAYVNDQPVSVSMLRRIGESLVEVHGQFENQRLMREATHRDLLDSFGGLSGARDRVADLFTGWREAAAASKKMAEDLETARREEEYLRHAVDEMTAVDPQPGEERELAETRNLLMHAERLIEAMNRANAALNEGNGVEGGLRGAARALEKEAETARGRLDEVLAALDRAALETAEAASLLDKASADLSLDGDDLEKTEERLFNLRALARKHGVSVDDLPVIRDQLSAQLSAIEDGGQALQDLKRLEAGARKAFADAARELSEGRRKAGGELDIAVGGELEPLRLGAAAFKTMIEALPEEAWGENGCDSVAFQVATNPGAAPGPLNRISSGGEMARFMLALKVVLAKADPVPTLIFDEVDANVGGAVAAAVGERLAGLAGFFQVLVITHSPQVASRGAGHLRVSKGISGEATVTSVEELSPAERKEEIARMLAGAKITEEARAAADSLLAGGGE
ncbi:MAG: DNA repair protein RecN [Rhodospirillales bacterium]|nr:DNA repair protein RecN [Rhodospirillales bacterium]